MKERALKLADVWDARAADLYGRLLANDLTDLRSAVTGVVADAVKAAHRGGAFAGMRA
jgi:hypothetical protein